VYSQAHQGDRVPAAEDAADGATMLLWVFTQQKPRSSNQGQGIREET